LDSPGSSMNIILFCCGSSGDVLPFVRIGSALCRRGHQVRLITHAGYEKLANDVEIEYDAYDMASEYAAFLDEAALLNTPSGIPKFLRKHSFPRVGRVLDLIGQQRLDDTLLITPPLFDTATRMAAEKLGLPLMWIFLAPIQVTAWQLRNTLFHKVLSPDIDKLRVEVGLEPVSDWSRYLAFTQPSLGLWTDWFAEAEDGWIPGVTPVGFLTAHPAEGVAFPADVEAMLDAEPAPILITGGTGRFLGEEFYAAGVGMAELLDIPALVVTPYRELLPKELPSKVVWHNRLPFKSLLPRVRAVVHHGGIGTLGAAASSGTPQLILAFGADRPDNGARVQKAGIGKVLPPPQWQPPVLAKAIRDLTQTAAIQSRCRGVAERIANHDTFAAAVSVIQNFTRIHEHR